MTLEPRWSQLTDRERSLLRARCDGATVPELAREMACSAATIEQTVKRLLTWLGISMGVRGQTRLPRFCYALGRMDALAGSIRRVA